MKDKTYQLIAFFTCIYIISPIALAILAGILAPFLGCENLNEGSVPKCPAGEKLSWMFVAGWYFFFTIPSGLVILAIASLFREQRRR